MSNNRPPGGNRTPGGNKPPGKNFPGANSSFFESRPPINNNLNANNGFTWSNPNQNPLKPQFFPPKSTPGVRIPSKLPPVKPGLGLGRMASGFKAGLPGLALMAGLLLLDLWLDQPAPPPSSPDSSGATPGEYVLDPAKSYIITVSSNIRRIESGIGFRAIIDYIANGTFSRSESFENGEWRFYTVSPHTYITENTISNAVSISPPKFGLFSYRYNSAWGYIFTITESTGAKSSLLLGYSFLDSSSLSYEGLGCLVTVKESGSTQLIAPTPQPSPPPYSIAPSGNNRPLAPLENSSTAPPFTPFAPFTPFTPFSPFSPSKAPDLPKTTPDEEEKNPFLPPFPGFYPPNFPQLPPLITRRYTISDPVLDYFKKTRPVPRTVPRTVPETAPGTAPGTPPGTAPVTTPGTTPGTSPGTTPENSSTPNKDRKVGLLFPPFPIINPQDPQIKKPDSPPNPVNQTPPGNNCCVPTPIDNKLNRVNDKLDLLTPSLQAVDLTLLNIINNKLGPQINGGLSGYLQDRFTKLWKSRVVDRALNLMATAAAIHNAVMLSRNIGSTLVQTLANTLSIIGIKDGDEVAQNFSTVIGDSIENIIKGLIGAENYTELTQTWAKANRIYQSAINIYQLMTDSLFGITSGLEQTAKYTGKIGNALRKSGVILENSYNWMSETFNFSSGKNRKIDRVIQGLQQASEVASDLESITSEFRSVTENVAEIKTQIDTIKGEVAAIEKDRKDKEDKGKKDSQSPEIDKSDLNKPDN